MSKTNQNQTDTDQGGELSEAEQLKEMVLSLQAQVEALTNSQPHRTAPPDKIVLSTWKQEGCNDLRINDLRATEAAAIKAGYKKAA